MAVRMSNVSQVRWASRGAGGVSQYEREVLDDEGNSRPDGWYARKMAAKEQRSGERVVVN